MTPIMKKLALTLIGIALLSCANASLYGQETRRGGATIGVEEDALDVSLGPAPLPERAPSPQRNPSPGASAPERNLPVVDEEPAAPVVSIPNDPNGAKSAPEESASQASDGSESPSLEFPANLLDAHKGLLGPETISATLKALLVMAVFTLAPALLLMTTCYVRFSVVFALLRQGLGAGQAPSNQVLTTLSIFLTLLVMTPVWTRVYQEAVVPYAAKEATSEEALERGLLPIREFLGNQIERTGNGEIISLFLKYAPVEEEPQYYEDVPLQALAPAFLLSELKTAFLIGFQILLPFLIIDLIVSATLVATGMMMLPPAIVSLPFKLALFVMVDGWTLLVKSLLASVS